MTKNPSRAVLRSPDALQRGDRVTIVRGREFFPATVLRVPFGNGILVRIEAGPRSRTCIVTPSQIVAADRAADRH